MKYFVIFCILVLVFMGGLLFAEALTKPVEPVNIPHRDMLPHLIKAHECARDTHQKIVDDPRYRATFNEYGGEIGTVRDHIEWVRLYDITIEVLEGLK